MPWKLAILVVVFPLVVLLDQTTKFLAVEKLTNAFEHFEKRTLNERVMAFLSLRNLDNEPHVAGNVDLRKRPAVIVAGYWAHRYVENPGAAWGLLSNVNEKWRIPFFHFVSLLAIGSILAFFWRIESGQRLLMIAFSLVLGGAIGNYIDRVIRNYVIDFIDWHWRDNPNLHWPTFNVADTDICVGVGLILLDTLFARRRSEPAGGASPTHAEARNGSNS